MSNDYFIGKLCFVVSVLIILLWAGQLILTAGKKVIEETKNNFEKSYNMGLTKGKF